MTPRTCAPAPAALLLNGTVGSGESTTAEAVGRLLAQRGTPHAVVDLDDLRRAWPAPEGDRSNGALELAAVDVDGLDRRQVAEAVLRAVGWS